MSIHVMTWVWQNSTTAGIDRLVLLAVADSANDDGGNAWPSMALLSRKTGVNVRTAQRAIRRLVETGALMVKESAGKHGVNVYRVVMKTPPAESHPGGESPRQADSGRKSPRQSAAPAETTEPPGTAPPEPSLNRPNDSLRSSLPTKSTKPKTESRGIRLPDGWKPSAELVAWARREGYSDAWARKSTERFRDHWASQPGARGRKLDWDATWRNWLRNDAERNPGNGRPGTGHSPTPQPPPVRDVLAAAEARVAADSAAALAEFNALEIGRAV